MKDQLSEIKGRIQQAALKSGRNESDITLVAVSKTYPNEAIELAYENGCRHFGENKVQELKEKIETIHKDIHWHLIGHLQTNKVKYVVGKVDLIHSVDSLKLLKAIEKESEKKNIQTSVLLEMNVSKEASKFGFFIEDLPEVLEFIAQLKYVKVKGLMTVAPFAEDPEENRPIFRQIYNLSVDIQKQNMNNIDMKVLSMGMSNDYEVAIEEGSNLVRIGTAIFGKRNYDMSF